MFKKIKLSLFNENPNIFDRRLLVRLQADLSLKYGKPLGSQQKAHGLNRKISLNRGPGSVSYGQMPKF